MSDDLKPCPFCGSAAEIQRIGDRRASTIYACTDCCCRLETGEEWGHGTRWNTRADLAAAEIARLTAELARARADALEEAAQVADGYHQRALEWAKKVRGLEQHLDETDSSRIAAALRALAAEQP